ncbi:transglutaminase family protein [Paenibacillus sp. 32O-W]|uniref:transglutaminase-like domain-containing protein n=1 Tax=Paenibacillus sp. 32O-W TaxID=1695218 RepID=UPI0011A5E476|nr:transglutaminase-like domain-containing protein [Paenibacillus sp. 32O-W]
MRRLLYVMLAVLVYMVSIPLSASAQGSANINWLDTSKIDQGVIGIYYSVPANTRIKLMVTKEGQTYTYNLINSQETEWFPLQLGNGTYNISMLENISGNKYKTIQSAAVQLEVEDSKIIYLNSIQNVVWKEAELAVKKAEELTRNLKTDEEKVIAIYDYIINNISYDHELADQITAGYIPDIDDTLTSGKAICYGYSSLFAAMLRSVGIPAKLVMGHSQYVTEYHSWNEVFINDEWVTIDTTVDAGKSSRDAVYYKDSNKYEAARVY